MANDIDSIAAKLAKLYQAEPVEPAETVEPEPGPNKGNLIPSAGNRPDHKAAEALAEQIHPTNKTEWLRQLPNNNGV